MIYEVNLKAILKILFFIWELIAVIFFGLLWGSVFDPLGSGICDYCSGSTIVFLMIQPYIPLLLFQIVNAFPDGKISIKTNR